MRAPEPQCVAARRALLAQGGRALGVSLALALALDPVRARAMRPGAPLASFAAARPGESPPAPWAQQALRGVTPNRYAMVNDSGDTVLEIRSRASASSLVHPLDANAIGAHRLRWRWKTDGYPSSERFADKAGDDYAGRVYLMFDHPLDRVPFGQRLLLRAARALHGEDLPAATLCYLLDPRAPPDTLIDSPYTSRVRMIVVRSDARTGVWWNEERDLAADFARAFGDEYGPGAPPLRAIAVAADTDQTGTSVNTRFGDLALR